MTLTHTRPELPAWVTQVAAEQPEWYPGKPVPVSVTVDGVTARLSLDAGGEDWRVWDGVNVVVARRGAGGGAASALFERNYRVPTPFEVGLGTFPEPAKALEDAYSWANFCGRTRRGTDPAVRAALDVLREAPATLHFWIRVLCLREDPRALARIRARVQQLLSGCTCPEDSAAPHWGCRAAASELRWLGEYAVRLAPYRFPAGSPEREVAWSLRENFQGDVEDLHAAILGLFAQSSAT